MNHDIERTLKESLEVKQRALADTKLHKNLSQSIELITHTFRVGGKVLFCGNGGSAADAQHMAAELSGRFYYDRPPLFAEALHVNSSFVTAVANDYGYEYVFARMIKAAGRKGDVLVAISTSGNSPGILKAIEAAKEIEMQVIGMTGAGGGQMARLCDIILEAPSNDTPRIQEVHITLGHILCEQVEKNLFPNPPQP